MLYALSVARAFTQVAAIVTMMILGPVCCLLGMFIGGFVAGFGRFMVMACLSAGDQSAVADWSWQIHVAVFLMSLCEGIRLLMGIFFLSLLYQGIRPFFRLDDDARKAPVFGMSLVVWLCVWINSFLFNVLEYRSYAPSIAGAIMPFVNASLTSGHEDDASQALLTGTLTFGVVHVVALAVGLVFLHIVSDSPLPTDP
jgi:hypothetical protein